MAKRGKKYRAALEPSTRPTALRPEGGVRPAQGGGRGLATTRPSSCAFRLGIDPRKADQMVRGAVSLPHGIGKPSASPSSPSGDKATEAREAGADHVGDDDLVELLGQGDLLSEIDSVIATPDMMGKLGRLGKVLGPRGLMPNPKSGTVTMNVGQAVKEIKAGRVEYRSDRNGNVHAVLGKARSPPSAGRELRRPARGDAAAASVGRQGPLHADGDDLDLGVARHAARPVQVPRPARRRRERDRVGQRLSRSVPGRSRHPLAGSTCVRGVGSIARPPDGGRSATRTARWSRWIGSR